MYCQKCGNEITEGTAFCSKCGAKVETDGGTNSQTSNLFTQASDTNSFGTMNIPNQMPMQKPQKPKKPITKKWWFWCIIVIVAVIILSSLGGGDTDTDTTTAGEVNQTDSSDEATNTTQSEPVSAADIYVWLAEGDEFGYSVPEKSISFMESNPQFFPGNDKNTGNMSDHIDSEADYPHVSKSPDKYADKLMSIYGCIIDCEEAETDYGTITFLQIEDYSGYSYCMYYLGALDDAFENKEVLGYILPFGTITFENMGGFYTEAIMGAACYIEVCE